MGPAARRANAEGHAPGAPVRPRATGGGESAAADRRRQLGRVPRVMQQQHARTDPEQAPPARAQAWGSVSPDRRALACRDFDTLVRLHHARWGEPRSFTEQRTAFHRDFAARVRARMAASLVPRGGGRAVAAWYGFRFGDVEWYYQSGRDPDWDRSSVGLTLLARTLQGAFDDGMSAYAFLRGDEAYKQRFATRDEGLETVALARGPRGRAAISAARAAKRMPPRSGIGYCARSAERRDGKPSHVSRARVVCGAASAGGALRPLGERQAAESTSASAIRAV